MRANRGQPAPCWRRWPRTAGAWHHCRWYLFAGRRLGPLRPAQGPAGVRRGGGRGSRPAPLPPAARSDAGRCRRATSRGSMWTWSRLRNGATWQPASGRATLTVQGPPPEIAAGRPAPRVRPAFGALPARRIPGHSTMPPDCAPTASSAGCMRKCPSAFRWSGRAARWGLTRLLDASASTAIGCWKTYLDPRCAEMAEAILLGEREQIELGPHRKLHGHRRDPSVGHCRTAPGHFGGRVVLARAAHAAAARLGRRDRRGGHRPLHAPGRCRAAGGAGDRAGAGLLRGRVLGPPSAELQFAGRRGAGGAGDQSQQPLPRRGATLVSLGGRADVVRPAMDGQPRQDPLERLIERNLPWHARIRWVVAAQRRHLTLVSLTIWLLTMPLVMARFHLCTPVAVVVEHRGVAADGLRSAERLCCWSFGRLMPPLAHLLGWFCNLNLWLLEWCVTAARRMPGGHFWVPGPADWWLWGFYGGWGLLAAFPRLRPPRRWCVGAAGRVDRRRLHRGRVAARSRSARLHLSERGPRLRGAAGASLRPDDALRRRPDGRAGRWQPDDFRVPLVARHRRISTPWCSPMPTSTTTTPCRGCWRSFRWARFMSRR